MSIRTESQYESAIDEMMGMHRYIVDFVEDGADTNELVRLFLFRGLPFRDRSASDDRLIDAYDALSERLKGDFTSFAHRRVTGHAKSRVDRYIDYLELIHQEDAA